MPFPSKGCHTCRKRRIKCDEMRPVCQKCIKAARTCTGFDSENGGLPFRDETLYAGGIARRPRKARSTSILTSNQASDDKSISGSDIILAEGRNVVSTTFLSKSSSHFHPNSASQHIPRPLNIQLETQAIMCFNNKYIDSTNLPPDSVWSHLNNCRSLWDIRESDSILKLSITALSLAVFGRLMVASSAITYSMHRYVQALKKTKTAMECKSQVMSDDLLLSVMVLTSYEHVLISSDYDPFDSPSFKHADSAAALLKVRKDQLPPGSRMSFLDKQVRRQRIRWSIMRSIPIPDWLQNGEDFGEEGAELALDCCLVRVATLRSSWQKLAQLLKLYPTPIRGYIQDDLRAIAEEAYNLDCSLLQWAANFPKNGMFTMQAVPGWPSEFGDISYHGTMHVYPDLQCATTWNRYRGARLVTNTIILLASEALSEAAGYVCQESLTEKDMALSTIRSLVNDICASVAFHFGEPDDCIMVKLAKIRGNTTSSAQQVFPLVFPLLISAYVPGLSEDQRSWIKGQLMIVSKVTGSGVLESLAGGNHVKQSQPLISASVVHSIL